jgi:hypothetical protein
MLPSRTIAPPNAKISPLVLADRLITLAQEADRAGYSDSASRLLGTAYAVLDEPKPAKPRRSPRRRGF